MSVSTTVKKKFSNFSGASVRRPWNNIYKVLRIIFVLSQVVLHIMKVIADILKCARISV